VSLVVDELDLHGYAAEQAERRLEDFLDAHAVRSPGQVVRVITGRGVRSSGPAVLIETVHTALNGWLSHRVAEWAVDIGGGAYLVRLKGRPAKS
jgi:DNA-nicking Smr family endonuclease